MSSKKGYECTICSFSTNNKTNYNKHCKTQKHLKKAKGANSSDSKPDSKKETNYKIYVCNYCDITFNRSSNYLRHMNSCSQYKTAQKTIQELESALESERKARESALEFERKAKEAALESERKAKEAALESERKAREAAIQQLKAQHGEDVERLRGIIERMNQKFLDKMIKEKNRDFDKMGKATSKSMSLFSQICAMYDEAPPLKALKDIDDIPKLKHYQEKDNGGLQFCDTIREAKDKKMLAKYVGDIIISSYKTDDPNDQSFWSTDISRLNYAVRHIVNKVPEWKVDKKGVSVKKTAIKPVLKLIDRLLIDGSDGYREYIEDIHGKMTSIRYLSTLSDAMCELQTDKFRNSVLKYVSPFFSSVKNARPSLVFSDKESSDEKDIISDLSEVDDNEDINDSDIEDTKTDKKSKSKADSDDTVTQSEYERIMEKCRTSYAEAMRGQPSRLFTTSGLDKKKRK